jgi:hypothetical protein
LIFGRKVNEPLRGSSGPIRRSAPPFGAGSAGIRRLNGADLNDLIDFFVGGSI